MTNGEADDSILRRGADGPVARRSGPAGAGRHVHGQLRRRHPGLRRPPSRCRCRRSLFGHGLFGSGEGYIEDDLLQELANDNCVVVLAGDWIGLTERQITSAALSANDLNNSHALVEKLGQSVINFIALEHLVRGPMAAVAASSSSRASRSSTRARSTYLGASLGGIMGGTFMAYDPFIERGALGVPGGAWSLLIERSFAWSPLPVAANGAYEDQLRVPDPDLAPRLQHGALGSDHHRARACSADPLPGTPAKQILMYEAINDCLVTNLSTEMVARTMGIPIAVAVGEDAVRLRGGDRAGAERLHHLRREAASRRCRSPTCRRRRTTAPTPASTSARRCSARWSTSCAAARS